MNSHQGIKIVLHMYISATQCRETNRAINVIIILNLKSQSTEVSTSTAATPQTDWETDVSCRLHVARG